MAEIGHKPRRLVAPAAVALLVAATSALWMWSFTIDDAFISIRYARHLALGLGYRFNAGGPSTDGVTPLPWAFLLSPLAHGTAFAVLTRAKTLGCLGWLATAAAWGAAVGKARAPRAAKLAALVGLGVCVPLAAHAVSGMETALATSLATCAALSHRRPRAAAALAGLAASLRPEMLPWALVLAGMFAALDDHPRAEARGTAGQVGAKPASRRATWNRPTDASEEEPAAGGLRDPRSPGAPAFMPGVVSDEWTPDGGSKHALTVCALLSILPFAACALVRLAVFGSPAPLALTAKPGDLAHGLAYAVAAALVSVGPVMAWAPLAAWRAKGAGRAIVLAGGVHLVAVAVAGGDWMPFARLVAPVVPSLLYASVLVWPLSNRWAWGARAAVAIALGGRTLLFAAPAGRHIGIDRDELARRVAPLLADAKRVAAADIGWVSAATEADIVDLAGATDPEIAALGGGHTSKRIDGAFLLAKDPDVLVLYAETTDLPLARWREAPFPRVVEARLARDELVDAHFAALAFVPLGETGTGYYLLRRR